MNTAVAAGAAWTLVLLGVCAVAFPWLVIAGLAQLGSHSGGVDRELVALGVAALLVMGLGVGLVISAAMRVAFGRWRLVDAARVSAAGFAPFVIGLMADPRLFISFAALFSADEPVRPTLAAWLVVIVVASLAGVAITTRAALARARSA